MNSPFNEARYKALLEGLEISEVNFSKILSEKRCDSEFFQKDFIEIEKSLNELPHSNVGSHFKVTDGEHGSVELQESGIKYLTAENIKKGYVDISDVRYVSQEVDKRNARARVNVGDILISIKGTLGEIAVAEPWLLPANMNRDVAIIKPLKKEIPSEYVAIFLMSKYGYYQSLRVASGGVQKMITLGRLREFIIPEFSPHFYSEIKRLYKRFLEIRNISLLTFKEGVDLLNTELSLENFQLNKDNVNKRSFFSSLVSSGRLDAEYYQLKYDQYRDLITSYSNGYESIENVCTLRDKNYKPQEKKSYKYIELANIGKSGEITGYTYEIGKELPTRARRKVKTDDVIISSIEGSLESCALVTPEYNNALCTTGFYVVNSTEINPETLLVLFKSEPIQNLLKKGCSGTILTAINKSELQKIPIPLIAKKTQEKIKSKIVESFELRDQSHHLLDVAKQSVELAIEEQEKAAIEFIESEALNSL